MANRAEQLIEQLQGTLGDLSSACEELGFDEDDLTEKEISDLDEAIMCCPNCGWWVESSDFKLNSSDEEVCSDCFEED